MFFPLDVTADFGKIVGNLVFFLIGAGFGAALELAGFGDSRRLAAQFYFKDMTVLKTMFTGIVVACILIFLSAAVGWLDFAQIAVNQTFLWPGVVGGLIMGVGFVIGGYCPGTSIVSAASLKVDGILFFTGTLIGAGLFGESVSSFSGFWNSSFSERLLLSEWLGWSVGATVAAVTAMAVLMFYVAEKTESRFGSARPIGRWHLAGATVLIALALLTWAIGQPDPERKWELVAPRYEALLVSREVHIHPLEYVKTWNDNNIKLITLDLRGAEEFARFHLSGAQRIELQDLKNTEFVASLLKLPSNGVVILVSDEESQSVRPWQWLKAQGVANLFILERGMRGWGGTFAGIMDAHGELDLSRPTLKVLEQFPKDAFTPKIRLQTTSRSGGVCS